MGTTPDAEPRAGVTAPQPPPAPREVPGACGEEQRAPRGRSVRPGEIAGTERRWESGARRNRPRPSAPRCALLRRCSFAPSSPSVMGESWGQPVPSRGGSLGSCDPPRTAGGAANAAGPTPERGRGSGCGVGALLAALAPSADPWGNRCPGAAPSPPGSSHLAKLPLTGTGTAEGLRAAAGVWEQAAGKADPAGKSPFRFQSCSPFDDLGAIFLVA